MTTIACDGKSMAGDRKVTEQNMFYGTCKIFVIEDSIVGVAGCATSTNKWLAWFRAGCASDGPAFTDDDAMTALVLNRRGLFLYEECSDPDKVDGEIYAVGTGGQGALALMRENGWTATKAVKRMHKYDPNTGPKVTTIKLRDVPPMVPRG